MHTTALGQRVDDWIQCLAYIERITDAHKSLEESCANDGEHTDI